MATLFVRHKVKELGAWKAAYDAFDSERQSFGVTGHGAYQADGDPNDVTVYHHFESMDAAKSFAGSDRLKEIMKGAGVAGTPDIWFGNRV
ncbi:MAG: cyclase [Acidobacteriota bacterium]|nr:cyclase [Acidobacteriota bacterium]